ncbi:MAG: acyltransferase [Alphaproteobacteria bacterium]|nr:acyltransferase [Alphaproteobacteria bacterium]
MAEEDRDAAASLAHRGAFETPRIAPLESVRGLLALWVVVGHVGRRVLTDDELLRWHLRAALEPMLPVYVFMMLSGFVIFLLLDRGDEPLGVFLARRLFRLAPLYLALLLLSASLLSFQLRVLEALPWRSGEILDDIKIHAEAIANFWPHFAAHLLLLQGLFSDKLLFESTYTILSQSWSISLEWQFYLLAPLLFFLLRTRRLLLLILTLAAVTAVGRLGYGGVAFLPNMFFYFALGILSYYAYGAARPAKGFEPELLDAALLVVSASFYFFLKEPWPLIAWLFLLASVIAEKTGDHSLVTKAIAKASALQPLRWLGKVSYSIYLVHIPILYAVFYFALPLLPNIGRGGYLALTLASTIGATIAAAAVTYRFIEKPGMALGKRLTGRAQRPRLELLRADDTDAP